MRLFALFCAAALSIVALVVGVRLLLLARRTRELPELLFGLGFVLLGFLAHTLSWTRQALDPNETVRLILNVSTRFFVALGCVANLFATWWIFRRDQAWAKLLVVVGFLLLLPSIFWYFLVDAERSQSLTSNAYFWMGSLGRLLTFVWLGWESLDLYLRLKRRHNLGLTQDPLYVQRMLLWSVGALCIAANFATISLRQIVVGATGVTLSIAPLIAVLGLVTAVCNWLVFFPPRFYRRRFEEEKLELVPPAS